MIAEIHLDPPLNHPLITIENHEYLEVYLEGEEEIIDWFFSLSSIVDRTVVYFKNSDITLKNIPSEFVHIPLYSTKLELNPFLPEKIENYILKLELVEPKKHILEWFLDIDDVKKYKL